MGNHADLVRTYVDAWNNNDEATLRRIVSNTHVHHDPASPGVGTGPEGEIGKLRKYRAAFPDLNFTLEDVVEQGDTCVTRWTGRGTHRGVLDGIPPTGRRAEVLGMTLYRIAGGQIVESHVIWDALGLLQQLGVLARAASG